MNNKEVRKWFQDNGVEYQGADWGPRFDNGESAGPAKDMRENRNRTTSFGTVPGDMRWWWHDVAGNPWRARTDSEAEWAEVLEDFFAPYLALLPKPKGNVLLDVFADQLTRADLAAEVGMTRQGAAKAVTSAIHALTRAIADDDPMFRPPVDGRRRDFEEETRAARRVLAVYLARRK